jgi:hypothetical protein
VAFRHNVRFRSFFGSSCFTGRFFDPFFCRQFFFRNRFLFAQPVFFPYPVSAPYSHAAEQNSSPVAYQEEDLSGQVERLTDEVERLREEQASREQPRQAALQAPFEDKTATTIVVFRDGGRSEVQNFANYRSRLQVPALAKGAYLRHGQIMRKLQPQRTP